MRQVVALTALFLAPQVALAVPAAATPAAAPSAVGSPKGDGKMMYPMRRTTQAERGAAAIRAQERIKQNELKGIKSAPNVAPVM